MAFSNPYSPVLTQVSLPFSNPIPGGLVPGKQIQVQGIVQNHPSATGFSINLCEGPNLQPNCGLHFNPRFTEGCIVRNAMINGGWGAEERHGGLHVGKGQIFEIIFMVTPASFQIAVNGAHFTEFKHRLPMESLKYLTINGSHLKINFIKYEGGTAAADMGAAPQYVPPPPPYTPGGFVYPPGVQGNMGADKNILYNPSVPLTQQILGGMFPNKMIYISGVAHPGAQRFTINLKTDPSDQADHALHFDVRFSYGNDRNVVVRNTRTRGTWGHEERGASHFPFFPNSNFDIIIMATPTSFKVAVNNTHFTEYGHRLPLKSSKTLNITGDVRITFVRFQ